MKKLFKKKEESINITSDNYNAYNTLYKIKKDSDEYNYGDKKLIKVFKKITDCLIMTSALMCFALSIKLGTVDTTLGIAVGFSSIVVLPCLLLDIRSYVSKRQSLAYFEMDYPEIDTNVSNYELKKSLEKYNSKDKNNESINNVNIVKKESDETFINKETYKTSLKEKYIALKEEMINLSSKEKQEKSNNKQYIKNKNVK